jgi:hypothetical protein
VEQVQTPPRGRREKKKRIEGRPKPPLGNAGIAEAESLKLTVGLAVSRAEEVLCLGTGMDHLFQNVLRFQGAAYRDISGRGI